MTIAGFLTLLFQSAKHSHPRPVRPMPFVLYSAEHPEGKNL